MNHVYKLVWNISKKCWVPASECSSSNRKSKNKKNNAFFAGLAFLALCSANVNTAIAGTITTSGYVTPANNGDPWNVNQNIFVGANNNDGGISMDNAVINGGGSNFYLSGGENNTSNLTLKNSSVIRNINSFSITAGGKGVMSIESGSQVFANMVFFGYNDVAFWNGGVNPGAVGVLTVTGLNSLLQADTLVSAWSNNTTATILVEDGGTIRLKTFDMDNTTLTIDGSASVVNIANTLYMRARVNTALSTSLNPVINIQNGGSLITGSTIMGQTVMDTSQPVAVSSAVNISGKGSIWKNAGNIAIGSNANFDNTLTIESEGTLDTGTLTMGSVPGGKNEVFVNSGGVLKTWQIIKINSGSNSFLNFNGGILRAAANQNDFISGFNSVTLGADGIIFDTNGFDIGISASMDAGSSTGKVVKQGLGALTLNAASQYSGDTLVEGGLLIPNHNNALGTGNVTIGGAGAVAQMQVNQNIVLPNAVTVQDKGVLYGVGEVGATVVKSGGQIQAGLTSNDIATLTIRGDLTLEAGSTYHAQLSTNDSYTSDLLYVYGDVILDGFNLHYSEVGPNYEEGKYYTVIEAVGGNMTQNTPTVLTGDTPFLDFKDRISGSLYELGVFRNAVKFSEYALTPNQKSTAYALDQTNTGGKLDNYLAGMSASYISHAFDLLSGEIHATLRSSLLNWGNSTAQNSLAQLRTNLIQPDADCSSESDDSMPDAAAGSLACKDRSSFTGWAQVLGNWNQTRSDGNAAKSKANTGGVLLGSNYRLGSSGWHVGGMFGYGKTSEKSNERHSTADLQNYTLGMYAGKRFGRGATEHINVMGGFSYTHHSIKTDRLIPRIAQTLHAKYSGNTVQAFGEVGYAMAPVGKWLLEPFVGMNVSRQKVGSFEEDGGYAGVHSSAESKTYTTAMLGMHAQSKFEVSGKEIQVRGTAGLKQVLGNREITRTMAFNQGSPEYLIWGVPRSRSTLALGLQGHIALSSAASLELGFNGEFGQKVREQALQARLRWAF